MTHKEIYDIRQAIDKTRSKESDWKQDIHTSRQEGTNAQNRGWKKLVCAVCIISLLASGNLYATDTQALADSLQARYIPFSTVWSPKVKVRQVRVKGNSVTVRSNGTLGAVVFTPKELTEMRKQVSQWVLGHGKGNVSIYSGRYELGELVPNRLQKRKERYPHYTNSIGISEAWADEMGKYTLFGSRIALWASHGTYYNAAREGWIWQRATLWTTVEDLYSTEYARLVVEMLENAGATVFQPRGRIDDPAAWEIGRSGLPRWMEGARYWLEDTGFADTIWTKCDRENDYKADLQCRGLWVNHLTGGSKCNPQTTGMGIPIDACIALHTDGYDSGNDTSIVGTLVIYTDHDEEGRRSFPNGVSRQVSRDLADYVQTQIVEDIRRSIAPEWTRRQLQNANYCESRYPLVPSVLVEILSHKNMADMRYGLDPQFRFVAARAIYKGLLQYLCAQRGEKAIVQPLPISALGIRQATKGLELYWLPTTDSIEPTAKPTHYIVYQRVQGSEDWEKTDLPYRTQGEYIVAALPLEKGIKTDYRVVAANTGGKSFPSAVVSAYLSTQEQAPTGIVVDVFNEVYGPEWFADSLRAGIVPNTYALENQYSVAYIGEQWDFDRTSVWRDDDNCGWGMCYRDKQGERTIGNTFDYTARHGTVLAAQGISYISQWGKALPIDMEGMDFIDVITGKNKQPLADSVVQALDRYVAEGGRLLVSGSYIGHSLQGIGHYKYHTSHATRNGVIQWLWGDTTVYHLETAPNARQLFAESPEGLRPIDNSSVRIGRYEDMRVSAGVVHENEQGGKAAVLGFPIETVKEFDALLGRIYRCLGIGVL